MLLSGERQVSPVLEGIRRDHLQRYRFVAQRLPSGSRVLDVACGVGYGARILAEAGHRVVAIDNDRETIAYARQHYAHENITYRCGDAAALGNLGAFDVAVSFETIEHLQQPALLLNALRCAPLLFASVPNEDVFPFKGYTFHHRHYRQDEFADLLAACGFRPMEWFGQLGPESDVEPAVNGRTLIVEAERMVPRLEVPPEEHPQVRYERRQRLEAAVAKRPETVAILGLGPSLEAYVDHVKRLGGRRAFSDEVWGINAVGGVIQCDRVFHMDDVRVQEARAKAQPESNIARMLEWMREHPGPIYTSRIPPVSAYPGLVEFPLEDVIHDLAHPYFNSTAAYAVAYAIHIGVKTIKLFGFDFTYPSAHKAEKGRACVEFWLGMAAARGIRLGMPDRTTLMDSIDGPQASRLYGYDCVHVSLVEDDEAQRVRVKFTELGTVPTAAEIEARYDHGRHPNALVEQEATHAARSSS